MKSVKCTVKELYELKAQLEGFRLVRQEEGKEVEVKVHYTGLLFEPGVTEGMKRQINKNVRLIDAELEPIKKQRAEFKEDEKEQKEKELLDDTVTIELEEMDFSKIADLSFSMNYEVLYSKIFN